MTPIFLPKRKQFGFLKPPPSFETATNRNQFSKSIEEEINSNNKSEQSTESIEADKSPLPTPLVKSRDVQTCTAKNFNLINYNFDSLPQIDEEKFKPQDKFVSTVSKIRQQKPGVSVMQLKAYQDFIQRSANIKALLRLPFNMQNQNIRNTAKQTSSPINKFDSAVQVVQQLIKGHRREHKIVDATCRNVNSQGIDVTDVSWASSNRFRFNKNGGYVTK